MLASVIIPAHNAAQSLGRTLDALVDQRLDDDYEVIVVNDGSSDETSAVAASYGVRVVELERSVGPGAARNRGASIAQGSVLAFTDSDCVPTPEWLAHGLSAIAHVDLVQGAVLPDPAVEPWPFDRTLWVRDEGGLFESANLFVRRETFEHLGGFGDGLMAIAGAHFGEDAEFGWRARRSGARTRFAPDALVHHAVKRRSFAEFIAERRRDALFPELVRRMPELREAFLYRRWFLSRRSAQFVLAVTAGVLAALPRRRKLAGAAAFPYAVAVLADARALGPRAAVARAAADIVGFGALLRGSARARTLVL